MRHLSDAAEERSSREASASGTTPGREKQEEDYKLAAVRGKMDEGAPSIHVLAIVDCPNPMINSGC